MANAQVTRRPTTQLTPQQTYAASLLSKNPNLSFDALMGRITTTYGRADADKIRVVFEDRTLAQRVQEVGAPQAEPIFKRQTAYDRAILELRTYLDSQGIKIEDLKPTTFRKIALNVPDEDAQVVVKNHSAQKTINDLNAVSQGDLLEYSVQKALNENADKSFVTPLDAPFDIAAEATEVLETLRMQPGRPAKSVLNAPSASKTTKPAPKKGLSVDQPRDGDTALRNFFDFKQEQ